MEHTIIGRSEEKKLLNRLHSSKKAEFLAIYGRRRVGKTFLVRNYFKEKGVFFEVTGAFNANTKEQLDNFHAEFASMFGSNLEPPKNWREAFSRLKKAIEKIGKKQKVTLFLDELPWLATPKSGFLSALDYAWNRHFSTLSNVLLIVSGSAASWMIHNVVNNTGGLYGRLSAHLRLIPFTLNETEEYLLNHNIALPKKQICEIYMATGGIPKYLSFIEQGYSAPQIIQRLCFMPQSPLLIEFHKLYRSLFQNAHTHLTIMRTLASKRYGMTRLELIKQAKLSNSGRTTLILQELEEAGFITTVPNITSQSRGQRYRLNDEYTLFYLKWIEPAKSTLLRGVDKDYWIKQQSSASYKAWAGFAFESICLKHINCIKEALGIGSVSTKSGYWSILTKGKKQIEIDLLIDRNDQCMNLCEIKFYNSPFPLTKTYIEQLEKKKALFQTHVSTNKALFTTLISPYGSKTPSPHIDNLVTIEDLFRS